MINERYPEQMPFDLRSTLTRLLEHEAQSQGGELPELLIPAVEDTGDPYVVGVFSDRRYAVPLHVVREITHVTRVTCVPTGPFHLDGIVSLRGMPIPVVDIALRFGTLRRQPPERGGRLVVVTLGQDGDVALRFDEVLGVKNIAPEAVDEDLSDVVISHRACVIGAFMYNDQLVTILDVHALAYPEGGRDA